MNTTPTMSASNHVVCYQANPYVVTLPASDAYEVTTDGFLGNAYNRVIEFGKQFLPGSSRSNSNTYFSAYQTKEWHFLPRAVQDVFLQYLQTHKPEVLKVEFPRDAAGNWWNANMYKRKK